MQTRTDFAANTARRLRTVEHSLDSAIADSSLLLHDLTRHRAEAGFAVQAGHQAVLSIHAAQAALVEARTQLVAAHDRLYREAKAMRVPITNVGPLEDKPDRPGVTQARAAEAA